jgi:hypothetical protein
MNMITTVRTVQAMPGKIFDAITWGKEIAAIVKRVTGHELTVSLSFGRNVAEVAWIGKVDNASQIEENFAKLSADKDYVNVLKKAEGLVVPGSGRDRYWRTV